MPIVFVHGVNNRKGDGYKASRKLYRSMLSRHLKGVSIGGKILQTVQPKDENTAFPYWGDLATTFAWNMASLPREDDFDDLGIQQAEVVGDALAVLRDGYPEAASSENPFLNMAKTDFIACVEFLTALLLKELDQSSGQDTAGVVEFTERAQAYAQENPSPEWLNGLTSDGQFLVTLVSKVSQANPDAQGLGLFGTVGDMLTDLGNTIKEKTCAAATTAVERTGDFLSTKILAGNRLSLNGTIGRFFGDVFIYFNGRGDKDNPGIIPARIIPALKNAKAAFPDEPFVILAHSLGGVISYDLLTHFLPELEVDLFLTVGSQVSHFEELKLFRVSDTSIPGGVRRKVDRPANIKRWINVYDEVDIFSYACKRVFKEVTDYRYDTKTMVIAAHGAYFEQDRFYARLRERIES